MISSTEQPQLVASYSIEFGAYSDLQPGTPLKIDIYKNDELFYTFTNCVQGSIYTYTFNEVSAMGTVAYSVEYTANYLDPEPANFDIILENFSVSEYKPTFTLPIITCVEKGQPFLFYPAPFEMNENNLCPASPLDSEIKYERFEFDMATAAYVSKHTQIISLTGETGTIATPEDYAYMNPVGWTPTALTMVKFVVTVTNCSTSVEHATVFPVCGSWKIRRLACGDYRIYNYKNTNFSYSIYNNLDDSLIKTETILAFSYIDLPITTDGVYKLIADNITQFVFNFCAVDACILSLQKQILLDDNLCDECKMDKVLYQKALRLIPIYETWKKLLDKDWVYDIQYNSTDIDGELARIYDAQELYLEVKKLCADCGATNTKRCNC